MHRLSLDWFCLLCGKICLKSPLASCCEDRWLFQQPVQGVSPLQGSGTAAPLPAGTFTPWYWWLSRRQGAFAATCQQRYLRSVGELSCSVLYHLGRNISSKSEKLLCMDLTDFQVLGYNFETEGREPEEKNLTKTKPKHLVGWGIPSHQTSGRKFSWSQNIWFLPPLQTD